MIRVEHAMGQVRAGCGEGFDDRVVVHVHRYFVIVRGGEEQGRPPIEPLGVRTRVPRVAGLDGLGEEAVGRRTREWLHLGSEHLLQHLGVRGVGGDPPGDRAKVEPGDRRHPQDLRVGGGHERRPATHAVADDRHPRPVDPERLAHQW